MSDGTLTVAKARFEVTLHPALSDNPRGGVTELLGTLLLKYSEDLGGIVLAYDDPTILSAKAPVQPYFPYLHVDATASVLLFNPVPKTRLVAPVTKVGRDYIGLLLAGIVNVTIPAGEIRAEFDSEPINSRWVSSKDPSHSISVSDNVVFDVVRTTQNGQFVSLVGSLRLAGTGNLEAVEAARPNGDHKKKRKEHAAKGETPSVKKPKVKSLLQS